MPLSDLLKAFREEQPSGRLAVLANSRTWHIVFRTAHIALGHRDLK
jgi:hypothetical protein